MANALMGNFSSGTTGQAITETQAGGATALSATSFTPATQNVTVRIQGAGLASPVDLTLNSTSDPTVGQAITDLGNQVSSNTALTAARISVSGGSAGFPPAFTGPKSARQGRRV